MNTLQNKFKNDVFIYLNEINFDKIDKQYVNLIIFDDLLRKYLKQIRKYLNFIVDQEN